MVDTEMLSHWGKKVASMQKAKCIACYRLTPLRDALLPSAQCQKCRNYYISMTIIILTIGSS